MNDLSDSERYDMLYDMSGAGEHGLSAEQVGSILLEEGFMVKQRTIKSIMALLQADYKLFKNQFNQFMYICENADANDLISILFFAADLDHSRTIEQDEIEFIFRQLNIKCDDVSRLARLASEYKHISYELFYTVMQQVLRNQ